MPSVVGSNQRKLERADDHLAAFRDATSAFSQKPPVRLATRPFDLERVGIYVESVESWATLLLTDLSLIAGDVIHNARAALDHWVYEVASTHNWKTGFPIWNTTPNRREFDKRLSDCGLCATPTSVREALWNLQPWPEGTERGQRLWLLHRLDIADKHHVISTAMMNSTTRESVVRVPLSPDRGFLVRYVEDFPLALEPDALLWSGSREFVPAAMSTLQCSFSIHLVEREIDRLAIKDLPAQLLLQELVNAARDAVFELAPLAVVGDVGEPG